MHKHFEKAQWTRARAAIHSRTVLLFLKQLSFNINLLECLSIILFSLGYLILILERHFFEVL